MALLLLCSRCSALQLPARRFLALLEAMLRFTQRQPRRGWGLHPRDGGSWLLPLPPQLQPVFPCGRRRGSGATAWKVGSRQRGEWKE